MPLSNAHQDCQVKSGLFHLETASADLVCQCETTDKLVKSLLERLGPPQAENTRFATRSPFHVSLTTPAPSASLVHSAPFTSSTPISVERLVPSASFMRSTPSSSSACRKDPLQHFSPPEFDGNRFAGRTFYTSCRSHIHSRPEAFEDDSAKIHWVMSHMQTGRAGRWATQEFDHQARNGTFRFANCQSAFAGEFRKEFMPPKAKDEVIGMLATDRYFQGKRTVCEYLDQFRDLVEDSGYTDPKTIVVKFRRGLDHQIPTALTGTALGRPLDTDPEAWFHLAAQMGQDCATEDTFRWQVDIPSPATLPRTSLLPQPAPPTPACHLRSDSPSRSLVRTCTDAAGKAEPPRERCAAHKVLCPPASIDEVFYARSPAAALSRFCRSLLGDRSCSHGRSHGTGLEPDRHLGRFSRGLHPSTHCSSLLGCMYSC